MWNDFYFYQPFNFRLHVHQGQGFFITHRVALPFCWIKYTSSSEGRKKKHRLPPWCAETAISCRGPGPARKKQNVYQNLRGTILVVIRTCDQHKNLYIPLFILNILGPHYYVPLHIEKSTGGGTRCTDVPLWQSSTEQNSHSGRMWNIQERNGSIVAWCAFGSTVWLELWQHYGMPYKKKNRGRGASSRGCIPRIGIFLSFLLWAIQHRWIAVP